MERWVSHPRVEKNVPVFLNRLLAMSMDDQQLIFKYFSDTMDAMIAAAKSMGKYEAGPVQLKATAITLGQRHIIHREPETGAAHLPDLQFVLPALPILCL
jgi:hypothetical protein